MKKYLAARMRLSAIITVGALFAVALLSPHLVEAQGASEKIRLMADTLRARDSGNLDQAKVKAEELIKIAPRDENVQRLLASINRELDQRGGPATSTVYGQASKQDVEASMNLPSTTNAAIVADSVVAEAAADQASKIAATKVAIADARQLAKLGAYSDAANLLNTASASLTLNTATAGKLQDLELAKAEILLEEARALSNAGNFAAAEDKIDEYRAAGGNSLSARNLAIELDKQISDPYNQDINKISPEYVEDAKEIRGELARGRAQFLNGDYAGAIETFERVEAIDANNSEAKLFQIKIAQILGDIHWQNHYKTRELMFTQVDKQWDRPKVYAKTPQDVDKESEGGLIQDKLNAIVIPEVNFSNMELTRVVEALSELSVEYDIPAGEGVNIIPLFNANDSNPRVNISLRKLNLDRILQFVTQQVNFAYDVGGDAVTIQPSDSLGGSSTTVTEFFPISRATVIRLTGFRDVGSSSSGPVDPFAGPSSGGSSAPTQNDEVEALQSFFQSAGVNFDLSGASLAFDGEQLIVTQSRRNLERIQTILRNYNEVKQVEIESKFLEVSQGALEELGFDWALKGGKTQVYGDNGFPAVQNGELVYNYKRNFGTQNRSLNDSFGISSTQSAITVNGQIQAENSAPSLSNAIDLASAVTTDLVDVPTGWSVGGYDVDFAMRALARKTGSDLMSAPKVTVLSGKRASITVAQELRYPESYGDIESTASSSGSGGSNGGSGGSAAISITAGTPQDFVTRNVGVEMSVTPNVENDDTISLILEPRVTEFEGFVEYGGPSVAITGGTTVTVPAGFYQPIFSIREMSTEVTIFDGATVVMGGLTRDEVKSVNDSVPILGNIPGLGRLFRSEGETRQKRNLLIFVTANLVSPGGSLSRQNLPNARANEIYQNPSIVTPSGSTNRGIKSTAE